MGQGGEEVSWELQERKELHLVRKSPATLKAKRRACGEPVAVWGVNYSPVRLSVPDDFFSRILKEKGVRI